MSRSQASRESFEEFDLPVTMRTALMALEANFDHFNALSSGDDQAQFAGARRALAANLGRMAEELLVAVACVESADINKRGSVASVESSDSKRGSVSFSPNDTAYRPVVSKEEAEEMRRMITPAADQPIKKSRRASLRRAGGMTSSTRLISSPTRGLRRKKQGVHGERSKEEEEEEDQERNIEQGRNTTKLQAFRLESSLKDIAIRNSEIVAKHWYVLSPLATSRILWDLGIATLLIYILITEPLSLGFFTAEMLRSKTVLGKINIMIDVTFICDLFLNFRTGYQTESGELVLEPKKAARRYLETWFALDLVSSLPPLLEVIIKMTGADSGAASPLKAMKILKLGRAMKALKIVKIGRVVNLLDEDSTLADDIDDFLSSSLSVLIAKVLGLVSSAFIVAHLLACFMAASGDGFLEDYKSINGRPADEWSWERQYLVAMYWAFTTMTTVGYGDVTPQSDLERFYVIVAMSIGVSFYSYIIASVASMVTASDAKSASVYEKMDVLSAWMKHYSIDRTLRRKIRKYYQRYYAHHCALDERRIIENLVPGLQEELTDYILDANISNHELFFDLPEGTLWKIAMIVRLEHHSAGDSIVKAGAASSALYVLVDGECCTADEDERLVSGDSFGELCLLGVSTVSLVTVKNLTHADFNTLQREGFLEAFTNLPEVMNKIVSKRGIFLDPGGPPQKKTVDSPAADDRPCDDQLR